MTRDTKGLPVINRGNYKFSINPIFINVLINVKDPFQQLWKSELIPTTNRL